MRSSAFLLAIALGGSSLALVACGSSKLTTAVNQAQAGQQRGALFTDPKVRACLKKHGVDLPNFQGGRQPNFNGTVPQRPPFNGTVPQRPPVNGTVPQRPPANGNRPNFQDNPRFKALRAAMQACGVTQQFGRPPASTTPSTTPAQ